MIADVDLRQRNHELTQIAQSIASLAELFKDLSVMVIDQGTLLDSVEYNIEQTAVQMEEAVRELNTATRRVTVLHLIGTRVGLTELCFRAGTRRAPGEGSASSCLCSSSSGLSSRSSSSRDGMPHRCHRLHHQHIQTGRPSRASLYRPPVRRWGGRRGGCSGGVPTDDDTRRICAPLLHYYLV